MGGNNKLAINHSNAWWIVVVVFILSGSVKIMLTLNKKNANQNIPTSGVIVKMENNSRNVGPSSSSIPLVPQPNAKINNNANTVVDPVVTSQNSARWLDSESTVFF